MGIAGSYSHEPAGRRRTRIEGAPPVIFDVATVASVTRDAWTEMRKVPTTGYLSEREQVGTREHRDGMCTKVECHNIRFHDTNFPQPLGIASTRNGRFEFRFHASGIHEEQKTLPHPRQSHRQRLPTLSSLKSSLLICPLPRQETGAGPIHSNKAEGRRSRTYRQTLVPSSGIR
jgi:hypothetical protein